MFGTYIGFDFRHADLRNVVLGGVFIRCDFRGALLGGVVYAGEFIDCIWAEEG